MSTLKTKLGEYVEFHFLDGTREVNPDMVRKHAPQLVKFFEPPFYRWYRGLDLDTEAPRYDEDLEVSLERISTYCAKHSIDGLLGFSQGSILVSVINLIHDTPKFPYRLKFFIGISGSRPRDPRFDPALAERPEGAWEFTPHRCPTLLISMEDDQQVTADQTRDQARYTRGPVTHVQRPAGGHQLPRLEGEDLTNVQLWLKDRRMEQSASL